MFFFRKFFLIFVLAVFILLIFLSAFIFYEPLKNYFLFVAEPLSRAIFKTRSFFSDFGNFFLNSKSLKEENERLKSEIGALRAENIRMAEIEKENEFLRKELGLNSKKEFKFVIAEVVGFEYFDFNNSLMINVGEEEGIAINMPVIVSPNILIGKISKTDKFTSFVQLISHSSSKIGARTENTLIDGLIVGKNFEHSFLMEMMTKDKLANLEETVLTSGLDGIFPKNLLIGKIKILKNSQEDLFNSVEVEPAFDFKKIDKVLIIVDYLK